MHIYCASYVTSLMVSCRCCAAAASIRDCLGTGRCLSDAILALTHWKCALLLLHFPKCCICTARDRCPDDLAKALQAAGLGKLVQAYRSSETGGVGWRECAASPFQAFPYWRRVADAAAVLERTLPGGACARHAIQDELEWIDADTFRPVGRIDEAVQVGGINVFAAQVAAGLRETRRCSMHPCGLCAPTRATGSRHLLCLGRRRSIVASCRHNWRVGYAIASIAPTADGVFIRQPTAKAGERKTGGLDHRHSDAALSEILPDLATIGSANFSMTFAYVVN